MLSRLNVMSLHMCNILSEAKQKNVKLTQAEALAVVVISLATPFKSVVHGNLRNQSTLENHRKLGSSSSLDLLTVCAARTNTFLIMLFHDSRMEDLDTLTVLPLVLFIRPHS